MQAVRLWQVRTKWQPSVMLLLLLLICVYTKYHSRKKTTYFVRYVC